MFRRHYSLTRTRWDITRKMRWKLWPHRCYRGIDSLLTPRRRRKTFGHQQWCYRADANLHDPLCLSPRARGATWQFRCMGGLYIDPNILQFVVGTPDKTPNFWKPYINSGFHQQVCHGRSPADGTHSKRDDPTLRATGVLRFRA